MRIVRASASHAVTWTYGQTDHGLTDLLRRAHAGEREASKAVIPLVYEELTAPDTCSSPDPVDWYLEQTTPAVSDTSETADRRSHFI